MGVVIFCDTSKITRLLVKPQYFFLQSQYGNADRLQQCGTKACGKHFTVSSLPLNQVQGIASFLCHAISRFRSVRIFICPLCGKAFHPHLQNFVRKGHQYGGLEVTKPSVLTFAVETKKTVITLELRRIVFSTSSSGRTVQLAKTNSSFDTDAKAFWPPCHCHTANILESFKVLFNKMKYSFELKRYESSSSQRVLYSADINISALISIYRLAFE